MSTPKATLGGVPTTPLRGEGGYRALAAPGPWEMAVEARKCGVAHAGRARIDVAGGAG